MHQLTWFLIGAAVFTVWQLFKAWQRNRPTETTIFTPVPSQRRSVPLRGTDDDDVAGFVTARMERLDKSPRVH